MELSVFQYPELVEMIDRLVFLERATGKRAVLIDPMKAFARAQATGGPYVVEFRLEDRPLTLPPTT